MKTMRQQWRWYLVVVLLLCNVFTWYAVIRETPDGVLTVAFLDAGQGDAIYIKAPNGNQMLIDGGPGKKVLRSLSKVMPFYDRSIDVLALSHTHSDHIAGLNEVMQRYEVGVAVSSGVHHQTAEYDLWKKLLQQHDIEEVVGLRGMKINMGDGVSLEVLLPNQDVSRLKEVHDGMLVLQLHYGKTGVLFTGDMEEPLENYLVAYDDTNLKSDVLKVGHHGSRTSSSEQFVGYVAPTYAVIQSEAGNSYGHPHKETLATLAQFKVKIFRNDVLGTIIMQSNGERVSFR